MSKNAIDRHELDRFVLAQVGIYPSVLAEIRRGSKHGHWMWFIFPQVAGLGNSNKAQHFGIRSLDEARAYLAHPVLGPRLRECVAALQDLTGATAQTVFGEVDAMKLRSSLTLFIKAGAGPMLEAAMDRWFAGDVDEATIHLLADGSAAPSPL